MLRSVLFASRIAFEAASSQLFGDSDINSMTLTTFAMIYSSIFPFEDRTRNGERFLIDVRVRQFEGVLDQFATRVALFGQQNFHDIESKHDVRIIEQS